MLYGIRSTEALKITKTTQSFAGKLSRRPSVVPLLKSNKAKMYWGSDHSQNQWNTQECFRVSGNFARRLQGHLEHIWKEHDFYAKGYQRLKLWGMMVHRMKFETCKVLEVHGIFVGFNKLFYGFCLFGSPCTWICDYDRLRIW